MKELPKIIQEVIDHFNSQYGWNIGIEAIEDFFVLDLPRRFIINVTEQYLIIDNTQDDNCAFEVMRIEYREMTKERIINQIVKAIWEA